MKRNVFLILAIGLLSIGCETAELNQEMTALTAENARLRKQLEAGTVEVARSTTKRLVHVVYFKLKPDLDENKITELITSIQTLNQIEWINDLQIGHFANLGDKRAMSDFQLVMSMTFESGQQYRQYQQHPIHMELKQNVGIYLSGPPVTYDYWPH